LILPGAALREELKKLDGPKPKRAKTVPAPTSRRLTFAPVKPPKAERQPREKTQKQKNDPRLVAAARELKDRWLERLNGGDEHILPMGKYDVARVLPANAPRRIHALPQAA
jgi:hypothetical protein